ncbi:hypothetical protein GCK32_004695 [Trichostrongylus colubriformis]|uniref:Glutamate--cysteine ligase n=1 Tax=Trichostrongylus colubriformis TaxID=6319 RepID=A0AAN8FT83_TRICO
MYRNGGNYGERLFTVGPEAFYDWDSAALILYSYPQLLYKPIEDPPGTVAGWKHRRAISKAHCTYVYKRSVADMCSKALSNRKFFIQVFRERIEQDDEKSTEHFETIQSSNWMNMRFKPPPPDAPEIGWRVEFRPTEVQLTDFENAAYVCFVVLLTRVIISFRLTYLLPISMVTENMKRAQKRDAVSKQKFLFRKSLATCKSPPENLKGAPQCGAPSEEIEEMTINEIINGREGDDNFPGLVPLIKQYLDSADVDVDTRCTISQYLNFISVRKRASGEIWTLAHWIRHFVDKHPAYLHDSQVPDETVYDLLVEVRFAQLIHSIMLDSTLLGDQNDVMAIG